MRISDKTRKLLWGRSGNRCAICKCELVMDATESDNESIVGDECHIVTAEQGGPRYDPLFPQEELDHDGNLLLLCKVHHKMVDDQESYYNADKLHQIKREHLEYVRRALQPLIADEMVLPVSMSVDMIEKEVGILWSHLANELEEIEVIRFRGIWLTEVRYEDANGPHWYELYQVPGNRFIVYHKHVHRFDYCRATLIGADSWGNGYSLLTLEELQDEFPALATRVGLPRVRVLDL